MFSHSTVYDCQVQACKEIFQEKLPSGCQPIAAQFNGRPVYDISGFDAHQVVGVLPAIVNDKDKFIMNKTFYLLIRGSLENTSKEGFEEFFRFTARPSTSQPGNAIVFLRPRGKKRFNRSANSSEELNGALRAFYDYYDLYGCLKSNTTSFAWHMKRLFQNNAKIGDLPQPTVEVYMILLFEIARRLVKSNNPSERRKKQLDDLPIASAIATLITLLEFRRCSFEDVFLPGGKFHCFTGKTEARERAIHNINKLHAISFSPTKEHHVKELQELFYSETRRPAEMSFCFKDIPALTADITFIGSLVILLILLLLVFAIKSFNSVKSNGHWASNFSPFNKLQKTRKF